MKKTLLALGIAAAVAAPAPAQTAAPYPAGGPTLDIIDTAAQAGRFNTLIVALDYAGLVQTLKGPGPFTVFAPTDAAFAALPPGTIATLIQPENQDDLETILLYHVVADELFASDVLARPSLDTVSGQRLSVWATASPARVGPADLVITDIACTNGVIHVIDAVLPPKLETVPERLQPTGRFDTLLAAVDAADLETALGGPGPFTVFAPTDVAFSLLPAGTVADLLLPENKPALIDLLSYHVIPGRVYSDQAIAAGTATTLQGSAVAVTTQGRKLLIDGVRVLRRDFETRNGVVHVIEEVLMPGS